MIEKGPKMARIGYGRVSTADQNIDPQIEELKQAGCEKIFQEKISSVKSNRAQLQAMIEYIREGDEVVVCKLDRIARSTRHLLDLVDLFRQKGVVFRVLNIALDTSTPTGMLMLTMLGAVATFEREIMLERQRDGIKQAKTDGKYKGRKPTARAKSAEIHHLLSQGYTKSRVAKELGIGVASIYRILSS